MSSAVALLRPSRAVALFALARAFEAWDAAKHPHIPDGFEGAGQWMPLDEWMQVAIAKGGDDPLGGVKRPALMQAAKDRGIYRRKGITEPELRAAIEADIREKGVSDRAKALAKALDEVGDKPAAAKKAASKALLTTPDGKPDLDKMTVPQLKAYAAERGIAVKGLTRKRDVVAHIRRMEGGAALGHARLQGVDPDGPMPSGQGAPKVPAKKAAKAAAEPEVPKAGGAKREAKAFELVAAAPRIDKDVDADRFEAARKRAAKNAGALAAAPVRARYDDPKYNTKVTGLESPKPLPLSVQRAVTRYMGAPASINDPMRVADEKLAITQSDPAERERAARNAGQYVREIDKAMDESPLQTDVVVYRGVPGERTHIMDRWLDEAGGYSGEGSRDFTGLTWTDGGYVSTSASREYAEGHFADSARPTKNPPILMRVVVPKGTGALQISTDTTGLRESELLLDRGLTYRVVADHGFAYGWHGPRMLDVEIVPAAGTPAAGKVAKPRAARAPKIDEAKVALDAAVAGLVRQIPDDHSGMRKHTEEILAGKATERGVPITSAARKARYLRLSAGTHRRMAEDQYRAVPSPESQKRMQLANQRAEKMEAIADLLAPPRKPRETSPTLPDGRPDLDRMTVPQLWEYVVANHIPIVSLSRKSDIIAHIRRTEADPSRPKSLSPQGGQSAAPASTARSLPRSGRQWNWETIQDDNMVMHGDSASMGLAQALRRAGREDDAQYVADMRYRISNPRGEHAPNDVQQMADDLRAMMDREPDAGLRARYQRALEDIDAPAKPPPTLPASTPPVLRRIVEELNMIPNARRTGRFAGTSKDIAVVDRVAAVIRNVDAGNGGSVGTVTTDIRDALRSLHESVDGAMQMWRLADLLEDREIGAWVRSHYPKA